MGKKTPKEGCNIKDKVEIRWINYFWKCLVVFLGPLNNVEKKYAPKQLYAIGQLSIPLTSPRVSVIGSRKASSKGFNAASIVASFLAKHKVTVVSGLAEGIDSAAHKGAIEANGQTIAVLGTPLNKFYPYKNQQLQEYIMQKQLAISQFPIGYPIMPKNFVIRNRTMALISDATIIMEAGNSSGSLHQGWEALRLGRPLFIWSPLMQDYSLNWTEKLAGYGAVKFTDPEEVLDELPSQKQILEVIQ
jgi:DNA processing protein